MTMTALFRFIAFAMVATRRDVPLGYGKWHFEVFLSVLNELRGIVDKNKAAEAHIAFSLNG